MNPSVSAVPSEGRAATPGRAIVWLEWTALALLVALFVWKGLVPAWRRLNTDFPNYYLAARLYRGGYPLERLYDWIWFQRQKDHAGIDQGLVGYGLLTPFSALVVAPLAPLSALAAKRCWLSINILLLAATILLLRTMTRLPARRIAIVAFLAVIPLRTCFEYGQQHVLVLFLLTLAGWLYLRGSGFSSGVVLAIASVLKLYPALFAVYFLLKAEWRALVGFCLTLALLVATGAALFGTETLRVYAMGVLPRALLGEGMDPYYVGINTLTVLLRRLFIAEPELNPHPLAHAPAVYSLLQPSIQALLCVSALWLVTSGQRTRARERLEWGALVALLMVLSTAAATYHFCALILATVVGVDFLLRAGRAKVAVVLVVLHGLVCFPLHRFVPAEPSGWRILFGVPRLYALLVYSAVFVWTFAHAGVWPRRQPWKTAVFGLAFVLWALFGVLSNMRHFRGQFESYAGRLPAQSHAFIATTPAVGPGAVYFSRMADEGYGLDRIGADLVTRAPAGMDLFHPALTSAVREGWVELSSLTSRIARFPLGAGVILAAQLPIEIEDAEQPAISADGKWLGFIREQRGRGSLWVRSAEPNGVYPAAELQLVDAARGVLDFAFFPDDRIVLAARQGAGSSLFVTSYTSGPVIELATSDRPARYPAVSPDGRWLAYSLQERGAWQLQLMDLATREQRRLTHADCNSIMPVWAPDSTSIVYATDCGRGVGFTALCQIRVAL
jgi:hypothetical protein